MLSWIEIVNMYGVLLTAISFLAESALPLPSYLLQKGVNDDLERSFIHCFAQFVQLLPFLRTIESIVSRAQPISTAVHLSLIHI